MAEEFGGKVNSVLSGMQFVAVKSDYGNLRIAESPDHKTVSVSVVAPDNNGTLMNVAYSRGINKPGLEVNDKPAVDFDALGPQLAKAVSQMLAGGLPVSNQLVHEIGRLTTNINEMAAKQRGVSPLPLR